MFRLGGLLGHRPFSLSWPHSFLIMSLLRVANYATGGFEYQTPIKNLKKSYDFIVVGGGSSGCVVASRLSKNPHHSVLLIDAGPGYVWFSLFAAETLFTVLNTNKFVYYAERQEHSCLGYEHQKCAFVRGKNLGGTSNFNYMHYLRGSKRDFDNLENIGITGWNYSDVLPYLRKMEHNRDPKISGNRDYHGVAGPVDINTLEYRTPLAGAWLEAGEELGYATTDLNAQQQIGFMNQQGFSYEGVRITTANAYIKPNRQRNNLHVMLYTRVLKILINDYHRAYGVTIEANGKISTITAQKEIVLTTGVFETPKLLQLSGIGPREELEKHQIPVVSDLPVGEGMVNRVGVHGVWFRLKKHVSYNVLKEILNPLNYFEAFLRKRGPLIAPTGFEGVAYLRTSSYFIEDYPDISALLVSGPLAFDGGMFNNAGVPRINSKIMKAFTSKFFLRPSFSIFPQLVKPKSRGRVLLRSANPYDNPLVIHNFLTHPDDIIILRQGVKLSIKIGSTRAFRRFGSRIHQLRIPGCKHHRVWTDGYIDCLIRHLISPMYADVGTAKMGPPDQYWSVVDEQLRVYGVSGLRVLDVSVLPELTLGGFTAPAITIAEKGSDIIKYYWKKKEREPNPLKDWPTKK